MIVRAFITHKRKEQICGCQDRFGVNTDTKSIAVSDGMSQSWQQKIWAQLLVDTFISKSDWQPTRETIKPLCNLWKDKVEEYIGQLKNRPRNNLTQKEINEIDALIYRNERCLVAGRSAGATFVGIRFRGNEWEGSVLGDSCLIEWNGSEAKFYTSQDGDAFDNHPDYFDSNPLYDGKGVPIEISGYLSANHYLFLVSDPFSDFLIEHKKLGDVAEYVRQLLTLTSHESFEKLVDDWREKGMHDDDATLVIVEQDNSEALAISHIDNIVEMIEKEKKFSKTISEVKRTEKSSQDFSIQEENLTGNFDIVPTTEKDFINEFMIEYQRCLQTDFLKKMGKLKFKWTRKAAEEALHILFERYSVSRKQ